MGASGCSAEERAPIGGQTGTGIETKGSYVEGEAADRVLCWQGVSGAKAEGARVAWRGAPVIQGSRKRSLSNAGGRRLSERDRSPVGQLRPAGSSAEWQSA